MRYLSLSKRGGIRILSLMLILAIAFIFLGENVKAYSPYDLSYSIKNGIEYFKAFYAPFLEALIGDSAFSDVFFIKVLLLILIFVVVKTVLARVPTFKDNHAVILVVAIVVAILSVRYMTDIDMINSIIMSYETLGVAITTIIPFIIWFFFVEKSMVSGVGRRAMWAFFVGVFTVVWIQRYSHLGGFANYFYAGVVILGILLLIFDRQVRTYLALSEIRGMERAITDKVVLDLLGDLEKAEKMSHTEYGKRRAKEIRKQLKDLGVRSMR